MDQHPSDTTEMTEDEKFAKHVSILFNDSLRVTLSRNDCSSQFLASLIHASGKLASEAGEMIDPIFGAWTYGRPLDHVNILEEAGDILFYLQAILNTLGFTMQEVRDSNYSKLLKRYPAGYTDTAAIERADKQ
jgi:NTP pyrophosphatase (non-canonical NTP hydrolase)